MSGALSYPLLVPPLLSFLQASARVNLPEEPNRLDRLSSRPGSVSLLTQRKAPELQRPRGTCDTICPSQLQCPLAQAPPQWLSGCITNLDRSSGTRLPGDHPVYLPLKSSVPFSGSPVRHSDCRLQSWGPHGQVPLTPAPVPWVSLQGDHTYRTGHSTLLSSRLCLSHKPADCHIQGTGVISFAHCDIPKDSSVPSVGMEDGAPSLLQMPGSRHSAWSTHEALRFHCFP